MSNTLIVNIDPSYAIIDDEFYESLDTYEPRPTFSELAARYMPSDWELIRSGVWYVCRSCRRSPLPEHGWKIHVSSTLADAPAVLTIVLQLCVRNDATLKFLLDDFIMALQNSKAWSRGSSGKFMTVYPTTADRCRSLLDSLQNALLGYEGPYILSDRRYRDSNVYYRYGGFTPTPRLTPKGTRVQVIRLPNGRPYEDARRPHYARPDSVADLFQGDAAGSAAESPDPPLTSTLMNGRYSILNAISFSNTGGVYVAEDTAAGQQVIVKEARPHTSMATNGLDAVALLKKEYRLYTIIEGANIAPRPIDFFAEWEHYYLVEEALDGVSLRAHMAERHLTLRTTPITESELQQFFDSYRKLYLKIAQCLHAMHARNIVFGDVSFYNVMVLDAGGDVKFIDFEGAVEVGVDRPFPLTTAGFTPRSHTEWHTPTVADDCYGLGALMFAGMMPVHSMLRLDTQALDRFIEAWQDDFGMPSEYARVVVQLMHPNPEKRMDLASAISVLRNGDGRVRLRGRGLADIQSGGIPSDIDDARKDRARECLQAAVEYVRSNATAERGDRLFPADPACFETNGLCIAWGAAGVGLVLKQVDGTPPRWVAAWILKHLEGSLDNLPVGLYVGLAGVAWALHELGAVERAVSLLDSSYRRVQEIRDCPDLFYGLSGWGIANLRFYEWTNDQRFLDRAIEAGELIIAGRSVTENGWTWSFDGEIGCSMGHGVAGITLFLLYLYLATRHIRFAQAGWNGVQYVVSRAIVTPDGAYSWPVHEGHATYTPYYRWGGRVSDPCC